MRWNTNCRLMPHGVRSTSQRCCATSGTGSQTGIVWTSRISTSVLLRYIRVKGLTSTAAAGCNGTVGSLLDNDRRTTKRANRTCETCSLLRQPAVIRDRPCSTWTCSTCRHPSQYARLAMQSYCRNAKDGKWLLKWVHPQCLSADDRHRSLFPHLKRTWRWVVAKEKPIPKYLCTDF